MTRTYHVKDRGKDRCHFWFVAWRVFWTFWFITLIIYKNDVMKFLSQDALKELSAGMNSFWDNIIILLIQKTIKRGFIL
ncbi:hypothetical protein AOG55_06295 [Acidiplasma cupricumulans]|uniref:Uncharacterized protein n=1 Tax=Acidiplasma cupricumulans TaxID=312540 RepID=A0A0Q0VPJ9_9ARCH|nr:hypothetical protein AOG55_06295 [Acidiplasma cupricumulans]